MRKVSGKARRVYELFRIPRGCELGGFVCVPIRCPVGSCSLFDCPANQQQPHLIYHFVFCVRRVWSPLSPSLSLLSRATLCLACILSVPVFILLLLVIDRWTHCARNWAHCCRCKVNVNTASCWDVVSVFFPSKVACASCMLERVHKHAVMMQCARNTSRTATFWSRDRRCFVPGRLKEREPLLCFPSHMTEQGKCQLFLRLMGLTAGESFCA